MNHPAAGKKRQTAFNAAWLLCGLTTVLFTGISRAPAHTLQKPTFVLTWGKKGDKPGEFYSPIGIAINHKDEIFVTDVNNARVQKFNTEGKFLAEFDLPRDEPKRKSNQAGGIAVDGKGLLYVSFMMQHKIAVYSEDGKLVRSWGKKGTGDGEFNQPGGIVLAPGSGVFVADQGNHRIQKFTTDGKFLGKWGQHGDKPGEFGAKVGAGSRFGGPHFLALDSKGNLYTTEGAMGRVQQFAPDGKPLRLWGDKGQQPGGFGGKQTPYSGPTLGPIGIMVDKHDRVWISSLNDRVQAFTPDGKFLFGISESGDGAGQLARPHGMVMDSKGFLYVADAGNQRIQKFDVPLP
jgi:sugar lactone lactonase YvrE